MEIKMETSRLINRDARICIIGAGMAGLTAANYLMARYWADSDLTVIYSYSDTPMDVKAVQEKVIKNLGSMNLKVTDIKSTQIWDYFPHVSSENLPGFYEKLATLQGTRRTYYGGGLLNFELVENVTAWSKYLVDTWFS
jgi:hypothetical protein